MKVLLLSQGVLLSSLVSGAGAIIGWFYKKGGSVLNDVFVTLQEWTCWLLHSITDGLIDFLVWLILQFPGNNLDISFLQTIVNKVYMFNELLPVVEFCGMFAMYIAFRVTWSSYKLVMWHAPSVGGGM